MANETKGIALIILNAVNNQQMGKHKLASFLKGSRSKVVAKFSNEDIYGGILWHDIPTIEGFIEQLENMGFIKRSQVDEFYSYYVLTPAGRKIIDDKIEIPLQIIKEQKPITVGESEKQTLELFRHGKTINEIAKERVLVETTIYAHFYRLIVNNHLSSSEIIPAEMHEQIREACTKFEKQPPLKELKDILPPVISYEQIRCVAADYYRKEEV